MATTGAPIHEALPTWSAAPDVPGADMSTAVPVAANPSGPQPQTNTVQPQQMMIMPQSGGQPVQTVQHQVQMVVVPQAGVQPMQQPTQVVYVDQYGNPIQQPPQQQHVVVVQQPPVQQGVALQVASTGYTAAPLPGAGTIADGYYVPTVAYNPNDPATEDALKGCQDFATLEQEKRELASTIEQQNRAQDEQGCIAGCIANPS